MPCKDRSFAVFTAIAAVLFATPAQASDFTGIFTFMASLWGITFVWTGGAVFLASRHAKDRRIRNGLRIMGCAAGVGLTAWWIADPIAEISAILISWIAPIAALVIASASNRRDAPKSD